MSYNQLTISAPPEEEEEQVVQRFMEASRELAPTVQVSLAKRIIRPGSNKVVCLAARTTVPLNDDELASVSDLALRLSDGTNVKLSLSFFNDEYAVEPLPSARAKEPLCIPMSRSFFDPNRYAPYKAKNDSKLGMAICTVVLGVAAGLFIAVDSPLHDKGLIRSFQKSPIGSILTGAIERNPQSELANTDSKHLQKAHSPTAAKKVSPQAAKKNKIQLVASAPVYTPPAMPYNYRPVSLKRIVPVEYKAAPVPGMKASRSKKAPMNIFVPPPPPTAYSLDSANLPPYYAWQVSGIQPQELAPVKPAPKSKAKEAAPSSQTVPALPAAESSLFIPSNNISRASNIHSQPSVVRHESEQGTVRQENVVRAESPPNIVRSESKRNIFRDSADATDIDKSIYASAPVPGNEYPSFERIKIPGQ